MYRVDGFDFESEEMAEIARKEKKGIKYIKEKSPATCYSCLAATFATTVLNFSVRDG